MICESDKLLATSSDKIKTVYDLFKKNESASPDSQFLGHKPTPTTPYKWMSFAEAGEQARQLGSAFIELGLKPAEENFVALFARNRVEWMLTSLACDQYSMVSVPLYDTLGIEAISFILVQTQVRLVVCDDSDKAMQLLNLKSNLEHIIVIEKITDEMRAKATELNIKVHTLEEAKTLGQAKLKSPVPPKADDLYTICYTSGTTGTPKGAMVTHKNVVAVVCSAEYYLNMKSRFWRGQHSYCSFLPLAHMFERVVQATLLSLGGRIGFYQGDIKKLADDIKECQPTIICMVPRLLNRIYTKITDNLEKASALKKMLFKWAYAQKEKEIMAGIVRNNSMYDFVFKQIRESLGGKCRFIITGSAPASPDIVHLLRVVVGCYLIEGYGATETGGACSVQVPGDYSVGNIGPPFLCSMFKLIDVPEMNLVVSRDKRGEICIAGHNIFKGYFKDEEKTTALDAYGWYHSGDIGMLDKNGCMKVVDRVKNIFKLQQGEYIAPEKIETVYVRSKYVAQTFIYGNSYKSSLVSVVVPEESVVAEYAKQNGLEPNLAELCKNCELKKIILDDMINLGKASGLKGFEQVKEIFLHAEMFSVHNGLLTPTLKSKRNDIQKHFQAQIDEMYKTVE